MQGKNPDAILHTTEPLNRFEREFKKRDMGFTKRSGFNMTYDTAEHTKPVFHSGRNSLKKLADYTTYKSNSKLESKFIDTFNNTYNFPNKAFKLRQFTENVVMPAPLSPFEQARDQNYYQFGHDPVAGGVGHDQLGIKNPMMALTLARTLNQSLDSI